MGIFQTNCLPWDYPIPPGAKELPMCTSYNEGGILHNNGLRHLDAKMSDAIRAAWWFEATAMSMP